MHLCTSYKFQPLVQILMQKILHTQCQRSKSVRNVGNMRFLEIRIDWIEKEIVKFIYK